MSNDVKILGFAGSLRKGSYNRSLLRTAAEVLPPETNLEIYDLEGIPPFNADFESNMPDKVKEFKSKIKAADAILFVTPEYNFSIPGVMKNAIDWASRPPGDNSFNGKPGAIMSASTGILGGARAQYHLRQVCVTLSMFIINKPEVFVTMAPQKFDEQGKLTDPKTREVVKTLLETLAAWTKRLQK